MPRLRIIGDVHCQVRFGYLPLLSDCLYSVQLGDMGDQDAYADLMHGVDPTRHRFVPGNHDDYDRLPPHSVGDYGTFELGGVRMFFVRGAMSTDKQRRLRLEERRGIKAWWPAEELTAEQLDAAIASYCRERPEIMLSHTAPASIIPQLRQQTIAPPGYPFAEQPDRTSLALETMLGHHQPRLWFFGHFHVDWTATIGGTEFHCVGELFWRDLNTDALIDRKKS